MNPLSFLVEAVKLDNAVDLRKKRKIPAHADVFAWVNAGSELADDNVAGPYGFTAEDFDPSPLPAAVTTVARASSRLFMCHLLPPLGFDRRDF